MNYDIVGDVHGHAAELEALLAKLGYVERSDAWSPPPDRHLVFVGDLIDRGPDQLRVLTIARAMQDAGNASIVMGNHEFNAVGWATRDPQAEATFLRGHTTERREQHEAFLAAVGENSSLHCELVAWMRTLPLWLDLGGFRVVHACWHTPSLAALQPHLTPDNALTDDGWFAVHDKQSAARDSAEIVLRGWRSRCRQDARFATNRGTSAARRASAGGTRPPGQSARRPSMTTRRRATSCPTTCCRPKRCSTTTA